MRICERCCHCRSAGPSSSQKARMKESCHWPRRRRQPSAARCFPTSRSTTSMTRSPMSMRHLVRSAAESPEMCSRSLPIHRSSTSIQVRAGLSSPASASPAACTSRGLWRFRLARMILPTGVSGTKPVSTGTTASSLLLARPSASISAAALAASQSMPSFTSSSGTSVVRSSTPALWKTSGDNVLTRLLQRRTLGPREEYAASCASIRRSFTARTSSSSAPSGSASLLRLPNTNSASSLSQTSTSTCPLKPSNKRPFLWPESPPLPPQP
mmetsp:Transcript_17432/g.66396  ORF Transcript_17432/g.66396 Transcript_17432/m.66396 type:complete len:269 (-) Transcript_17432:264-1070(-)